MDDENRKHFASAIAEDKEIFDPMILQLRQETIEYGKLIYKSLLVLNGGALLLVPTLFQNIDGIPASTLLYAAKAFIVGLLCVGLSLYAAHLNFLYLVRQLEVQKIERADYYRRRFLECQTDAKTLNANREYDLVNTISFVAANFLGLISLVSLIIGSWTIAGAQL